ncbi:MAG: OmpL47-type beta-barrel domain-containing protein [Limisphaerales bacterium]
MRTTINSMNNRGSSRIGPQCEPKLRTNLIRRWLPALALWLAAPLLSQASLQVDQEQTAGWKFIQNPSYLLDQSLSQSFTPAHDNVAGVEVQVSPYPNTPTKLTIRLWDDFPARGKLLAEGSVQLPLNTSSGVNSRYALVSWAPVTVTPGHTYFFQPITDTMLWGINAESGTPFPGGAMYVGFDPWWGGGLSDWNLNFVEYYDDSPRPIYSNNFDSDPAADSSLQIFGNGATWYSHDGHPATGGFLRLTPAVPSQIGGILLPDVSAGQAVSGFTFECDVRVGNGTETPADGFSINFVRNNDPVLLALLSAAANGQAIGSQFLGFSDNGRQSDLSLPEEGTRTGLSVGFDAWDSGAIQSPPFPPAVGLAAPELPYDIPGLDIRIDDVLSSITPMLTLNGAADDPTSIQTGPFDGSSSANGLGWAHLKVALTPDGLLNVWYKGSQILTQFQTQFLPSLGRFLLVGRTGGADQVQDVDNIQLTIVQVSGLQIGPASPAFTGFSIFVSDSGPSVANPGTLSLALDGAAVKPTSVTQQYGITIVSYDQGQLFPSGSTHSVSLSVQDSGNPAQSFSATRQFTAPVYQTLPPSFAVPAGNVQRDQPGFLVRPYSTAAVQPNSLAWTESQLTGQQGPNLANLSGADANGFYEVSGPINWGINPLSPAGHFVPPDYPEAMPPGWPNLSGSTDNSSEEVLAYLEFPAAGLYLMGVNSDDGFQVRTAQTPQDTASALALGQYDGGRGPGDTLFYFAVVKPGVYPFRMIYENGWGGANCEWFTLQPDGTPILVNDLANPASIKAWRSLDTIPPTTIACTTPGPNGNGWNNSDVTVTLKATDNPYGSGVQSISYNLCGAQSGGGNVQGATVTFKISFEGITTVTYYTLDNAGNKEKPKTMVVRFDKTPPVVNVSVSPNLLWPPDHKLISVTANVSVSDSLSGPAGFQLVSVTSSEPDNGLGDGDQPNDIQGFLPGTACLIGQLRSERSGTGSGRVYTLTYKAADQAGNSATRTATVLVPHDSQHSWR